MIIQEDTKFWYCIPNVKIEIIDRSVFGIGNRNFALNPTPEGMLTTVAQWLCGPNRWGFHNDLRLAQPMSRIKQGVWIVEAAERALTTNTKYIWLEKPEYKLLCEIVGQPQPHPEVVPLPAQLARAILPIITLIENSECYTEEEKQEITMKEVECQNQS